MADVGVQVMKSFHANNIPQSEVDKFVQATLNYSLDQEILEVRQQSHDKV